MTASLFDVVERTVGGGEGFDRSTASGVRDVEFEFVGRPEQQVGEVGFEPLPVQAVRGTGHADPADHVAVRAADRDADGVSPAERLLRLK